MLKWGLLVDSCSTGGLLAPVRDIDDGDDLAWLRAELKTRPDDAPATRAALAALAIECRGSRPPD
jgi:hypothetical protein